MLPQSQIDALVDASRDVMRRAYSPYSGFGVGAAVLSGGEIHRGCNVENASYGLTVCAERTAIFNAVCAGHRTIRALAIAVSTGETAFPCGACRQVIAEFAPEEGDVDIYLVSDKGVAHYTLADLLPHAFKLADGV